MQLLRYITFLTVLVGLSLGVHYYLWVRLVRRTDLPRPWRRRGTVATVVLVVATPLALAAQRLAPRGVASLVAWPGYLWMGLCFLLVLCLAATEGILLVPFRDHDRSRRVFLQRLLGGAASLGAVGAAGAGARSALGRVPVVPVEVTLPRLPAAFHGTTIVQLTDLHIGAILGRAWLADVVAQTNALAPDLVAITGDLVDGTVAQLADDVAPLAELRARFGVFFVPGNHEHYSGIGPWLEHLVTLGLKVLRNQRISIEAHGAGFDLAGIDDPTGTPDLALALEGRDPSRELVLLAHQPKAVHQASRQGVGLQLSGHTHGGQIWPFTYVISLFQPYVSGLHQHGPTQIYVSNGTGFWGPPMRLGAPPEITKIVLKSTQR